MVAGVHFRIYLVVILAGIHSSSGARDLETTEAKSGTKPNHCAAIIDMCRARCASFVRDDGVMEYVQMTIKLLDSETTCFTNMTNPGESVPIKPNNTNRQIVMFNVPCCQQQHPNRTRVSSNWTTAQNPVPCFRNLPVRDVPDISSTTAATTETAPTVQPAGNNPPNCNQTQTFSLSDILLLIFVILCFILLCFVVGLLLKSRRRTKKTIITDLPLTRGNYDTQPTQEHSVAIDKHEGKGEKIEHKVNADGGGTSRNESVANLEAGISYAEMDDVSPTSDYIVLPNQSFPPAPKSTRPFRGRQDGQSEEIIIVGAKNLMKSPILGTDSTPNPLQMQNNFLKNTATDMSIGNGKIVERSPVVEKAGHDVAMFINDGKVSSPITFATTGRLPSKLDHGSATDNDTKQDFAARNRAQTDVTNSSWESSKNNQDDSIYNRLRSKKNDDSYNDYQRLLRQSQINQNSDIDDVTYDDFTRTNTYDDVEPVANGMSKIHRNGDAEDGFYHDVAPTNNGYVKNFKLLTKPTLIPNGTNDEDGAVKWAKVSENLREDVVNAGVKN